MNDIRDIRLNQVAFGLSRGVLGVSANRMGVWTQGCSLTKCPGCTSRHTWSPNEGKVVSIDALLQLARNQLSPPSGLTITGGEPTDQAEAIAAFIKGFRHLFSGTEIVLYTGLRWSVFSARFPALACLPDVVVAGPYVRTREASVLAGSNNQEVKLLTPLAKQLYQAWQSWPRHKVQVVQTKGGEVVTVGIPHTERMDRAADRVGAVEVTWDRTGKEKQA